MRTCRTLDLSASHPFRTAPDLEFHGATVPVAGVALQAPFHSFAIAEAAPGPASLRGALLEYSLGAVTDVRRGLWGRSDLKRTNLRSSPISLACASRSGRSRRTLGRGARSVDLWVQNVSVLGTGRMRGERSLSSLRRSTKPFAHMQAGAAARRDRARRSHRDHGVPFSGRYATLDKCSPSRSLLGASSKEISILICRTLRSYRSDELTTYPFGAMRLTWTFRFFLTLSVALRQAICTQHSR